jgi:Leucine-rich repeat (LRR) protein
VGWKRIGDDINDINTSSHHLLLPQFPCLSFLDISGCPMLTHMPTFPNMKSLSLEGCGVEILEATLNTTASQYSIGCTPLSMLKTFKICGFRDRDLQNVPQHWLQNLTSLENLAFHSMSAEHFEAIEIWFKDDINYFPSLQKITFDYCKPIKALPNWICNIPSLQHIKLSDCYNLELLPEEMPRLTNLHTLEIIVCPGIVKECQKETSATRTRIAHIPNIIMKSHSDL